MNGLRERPDLDALFAPRHQGYMGADVGMSIPLPDGRVFWVFGDTLMGRIDGQKRVMSGMPRNSAAIQTGREATPDTVELLLREGDFPEFFRHPAGSKDHWLWITAGVVVQGELFLTGYSVSSAPADHEALSFGLDEQWLVRIRDLSGDPMQWRMETHRLAHAPHDPWFASAMIESNGQVYMGGFRSANGVASGLVARVQSERLLADGADCRLEYRTADGWSTSHAEAAVVYTPGVSESTLWQDRERGRYLLTTYNARNAEFFLNTAPNPWGPWSAPRPIFRIPGRNTEHGAIAYTLRIHPSLPARQGEIVLSYVVNTLGLEPLMDDLAAYYPRFLSLSLNEI